MHNMWYLDSIFKLDINAVRLDDHGDACYEQERAASTMHCWGWISSLHLSLQAFEVVLRDSPNGRDRALLVLAIKASLGAACINKQKSPACVHECLHGLECTVI